MFEATPRRQETRAGMGTKRVGRNVGLMPPQAERVRHEIGRASSFCSVARIPHSNADSRAQAQERRDVDRHRVVRARGHRAVRITRRIERVTRFSGARCVCFLGRERDRRSRFRRSRGCPRAGPRTSCQNPSPSEPSLLSSASQAGARAAIAVAPHLGPGGAPRSTLRRRACGGESNWPARRWSRAQWVRTKPCAAVHPDYDSSSRS